jgi:hypothetical protein
MEHYAGIDVSLERSSVCVVDAMGRIVREDKVASEPEALEGAGSSYSQGRTPKSWIGPSGRAVANMREHYAWQAWRSHSNGSLNSDDPRYAR